MLNHALHPRWFLTRWERILLATGLSISNIGLAAFAPAPAANPEESNPRQNNPHQTEYRWHSPLIAEAQPLAGDPHQSAVDPAIVGVWLARQGNDIHLCAVRPWDDRTYLVHWIIGEESEQGIEPDDHLTFKAWLTEIGGQRFASLKRRRLMLDVGLDRTSPFDVVFQRVIRYQLNDDTLNVWATDFSKVVWEGVQTRQQTELFLAERGGDASIYFDGSPWELKRLSNSDDDRQLIKQVLDQLHVE